MIQNIKLNLIIILSATLISSWTWSIFSQNIFIGICCIFLSFLLLLNFNNKLILSKHFLQIATICLWLISSGYLFSSSFDKNLFHISENQYINVLKRQEIYSREFGRFYKNRFGIYFFNKINPFIYRYSNNISKLFDLDYLFISNYDEDKNKTRLPLVLLPFMITGLFYLLKKFNKKYFFFKRYIILLSIFSL